MSPPVRAWLAVVSLALVAFVIVTTEFIPVGLLPNITESLDVSLGLGGLMVIAQIIFLPDVRQPHRRRRRSTDRVGLHRLHRRSAPDPFNQRSIPA